MKYLVARTSKLTGRTEYKQHKCTDIYCGEKYVQLYPDRVWQFSKQGAKGIVDRENAHGWNYEYFMVPVSDVLNANE